MNQSKFYELYEKKLSANLNYIESKPLFTENTAKNFLSKIEKSNLNNGVFDLIDYEKLIYSYINFYFFEFIEFSFYFFQFLFTFFFE